MLNCLDSVTMGWGECANAVRRHCSHYHGRKQVLHKVTDLNLEVNLSRSWLVFAPRWHTHPIHKTTIHTRIFSGLGPSNGMLIWRNITASKSCVQSESLVTHKDSIATEFSQDLLHSFDAFRYSNGTFSNQRLGLWYWTISEAMTKRPSSASKARGRDFVAIAIMEY